MRSVFLYMTKCESTTVTPPKLEGRRRKLWMSGRPQKLPPPQVGLRWKRELWAPLPLVKWFNLWPWAIEFFGLMFDWWHRKTTAWSGIVKRFTAVHDSRVRVAIVALNEGEKQVRRPSTEGLILCQYYKSILDACAIVRPNARTAKGSVESQFASLGMVVLPFLAQFHIATSWLESWDLNSM